MPIVTSFGTKKNGDGRELSQICLFLQEKAIDFQHIIQPSQYHSSKVDIVTKANAHGSFRCDGLVTADKGIVLTILTADCVPIIFTDQNTGIIGISHNGWKGTLNDLSSEMIRHMCSIGSQKADIKCTIGPGIGDCCYEIYGDRKNDFVTRFGSEILRNTDQTSFLNLQKANEMNLLNCGIVPEHIVKHRDCTSCNSQLYWSYHRDGVLLGEHISFVVSI